jgi:hypothetical protein
MVKIASDEWLIDLARKECTNIHFKTKIKVEFSNNCLTAKITEMPGYLRNIYRSKKRNELSHQLIIVRGLKRYMVALPSKCYKKSIIEDFQTAKLNEENNKIDNVKNIIKIADNDWFIDLVSKECFDVQYGLKIKVEFFNDCLTAKIIKMSKDFRNERIPKKEKDVLKQSKIVQGLDVYTEALRSSLVDNRRKKPASKPRAKPKPPPSYEEFSKLPPLPKLPPISEYQKMLLAKGKLKSASKPPSKPPSKKKKK